MRERKLPTPDYLGFQPDNVPTSVKKISRPRQDNLLQAQISRFSSRNTVSVSVGVHNEAFSVIPMCVCNPDRSPRWNQSLRRSPN